MKEEKNILRILKETKRFLEEDRPHELKALSNQTIHSATISQDPDNIIVAVISYVIGKVLERENYRLMQGWKEFYDTTTKNLAISIKDLESKNIDKWRMSMGRIRNSLNKIDGDLRIYIKDVFRKAEINKAFKMYEHGLSSEKTANLLGVSLWDMASYIGQSSIADSKISISMPLQNRLKLAEDFFK